MVKPLIHVFELTSCYNRHISMKRLVNKKALFDFEIQDKLEAGIVLTGGEVKSLKRGRGDMKGSFVQLHNDELWLANMFIPPYEPGQVIPHESDRNRKLLVKNAERNHLIGVLKAKGLTIVPISFYTKGGLVKVELGIGRGKRMIDKRKSIKEREVNREMRRKLRQKN